MLILQTDSEMISPCVHVLRKNKSSWCLQSSWLWRRWNAGNLQVWLNELEHDSFNSPTHFLIPESTEGRISVMTDRFADSDGWMKAMTRRAPVILFLNRRRITSWVTDKSISVSVTTERFTDSDDSASTERWNWLGVWCKWFRKDTSVWSIGINQE